MGAKCEGLAGRTRFVAAAAVVGLLLSAEAVPARAAEVKVSAQALERTLSKQLFSGPDGRYYVRGDAASVCWVYAENPRVSFKDDRVVVHVHARGRLGRAVRGRCVGLSLTTDADVSFLPEAEDESVGFHSPRIERLSESPELDFLLAPFLSRKLPSEMKVNAADLLGRLLSQSLAATGYAIGLTQLKLHSMVVQGDSPVVDTEVRLAID